MTTERQHTLSLPGGAGGDLPVLPDSIADDLLTFAQVPNDLSQLPFASTTTTTTSTKTNTTEPASLNHTRNPSPPPQPQTYPQPSSTLRKTSPGLAARLKALGFGAASKPASPAGQLHRDIGRLDENQLRELNGKHQTPNTNSVVARRGRPWKGPSAESPSPAPSASDSHLPAIEQLPELPQVRLPEPLVMDTQKYRLPDHDNGNGTKVTLETRREHLERDTCPPSPYEVASPPPPPVPPKETPPSPLTPPAVLENSDFEPGLGSYFTPGRNRPGSIYTLSRASFADQLAQLTSLQLPDAESLSSKVAAIPTAQVAAKALINAADQIRSWISKASEVIGGLNSDDDVEWSAAGGREGLAEVENAISRFEELINAYVTAIEALQGRGDIVNVPAEDLKRAVYQMEAIIGEWARIRGTLQNVRGQVEIAMEWEELWNNVLGEIQGEMDELSRLVFEMEERRHKSLTSGAASDAVDIGDLETIVEDTPPQAARLQVQSRLSMPVFPISPTSPGTPNLSQDDSSLLALFARMQPLRASLDFLPMRLSVFQTRADQSFPTACEELDMRREGLDATYKKLEKDAESLRKELGEDRWVIVFRGAGRQAQKMHESVERSLVKLRESIDAGLHLTNQTGWVKKLESYEAKRTHYGPAIERVLSIIDKGVRDRLTVNGEILRLHTDLQARWQSLKDQTMEMDATIDDLHIDMKSAQLRDSVSSMLSNDRSTQGSGHDTPQSSPPSSVIMSTLGLEPYTPVSKQPKKRSSSVHSSAASGKRQSSLPAPSNGTRLSGSRLHPAPPAKSLAPASNIQRPASTLGHRPKWNGSTNTISVDTGHNFKPLNLTTPSPYRRTPTTQRSVSSLNLSSGGSRLPTYRSPLGRSTSESPMLEETPTRTGHSKLSFRERLAAPGAHGQQSLAKPRLSTQTSTASTMSTRRASMQPSRASSVAGDSQPTRPASSLAGSTRRTSLASQARGKAPVTMGRATPANARLPIRIQEEVKDNKPKWRH